MATALGGHARIRYAQTRQGSHHQHRVPPIWPGIVQPRTLPRQQGRADAIHPRDGRIRVQVWSHLQCNRARVVANAADGGGCGRQVGTGHGTADDGWPKWGAAGSLWHRDPPGRRRVGLGHWTDVVPRPGVTAGQVRATANGRGAGSFNSRTAIAPQPDESGPQEIAPRRSQCPGRALHVHSQSLGARSADRWRFIAWLAALSGGVCRIR
jgi:hypothetical protein